MFHPFATNNSPAKPPRLIGGPLGGPLYGHSKVRPLRHVYCMQLFTRQPVYSHDPQLRSTGARGLQVSPAAHGG